MRLRPDRRRPGSSRRHSAEHRIIIFGVAANVSITKLFMAVSCPALLMA